MLILSNLVSADNMSALTRAPPRIRGLFYTKSEAALLKPKSVVLFMTSVTQEGDEYAQSQARSDASA
jgi:hypothetical protein